MNSDNVKKGPERAPNRSLFYALGYTPEELDRPLIGVVSAYSEIVPGHAHLDKIADAVKAGVRMAGGTPILIPAIGVCDGIAMGHVGMKYSLASRELICDSVETMFMAHQLDGLVLVPNCDKIVPGMVMAAVRMDVPAVVCSGGPMLAGRYGGEEVSLSKMFEAVGAYKAGMIDDAQLEDCTCNCCPGCGSCSGMYTANSMNCLCEAIGIALPGNGTIPAVYAKRLQLAKHAGMAIMDLVSRGVTARQIINERSIRNALTCDMALGCSTNTVLHLLAIAQEAGCPIDLKLFNEISARTPNLCHLAPAGPTHMPDLTCSTSMFPPSPAKRWERTSAVRRFSTTRRSAPSTTRTVRPAVCRFCGATLRRTAVSSSAAPLRPKCRFTAAPRASLTARTPPLRLSTQATSTPAT